MLRRKILTLIAPFAMLACAQGAAAATLLVTKSASCGCCAHWVEHMKKAGFDVTVQTVDDVTPIARRLGVPDNLRSCHTSQIDGYVVEGHVPATDVKKLLAAKPKAVGIAVPGMPAGSPGMHHSGRSEPYQTILFDKSGKRTVFASH